jgi:hypothetical protein
VVHGPTYTTTELNLADFFHANSTTYKPVAFATVDEAIEAYVSGRCDVYTADASRRVDERKNWPMPRNSSYESMLAFAHREDLQLEFSMFPY